MLKFKQQHTTIKERFFVSYASNNETKKEIKAFLFIPLLAEYIYLYENTNEESLNCINSKNTRWCQMKRQAANY